MPSASHDGVSLRYDRAGSGPAVLLIHGWTCNRTFWQHQVTALRDRFTVITVDLRGHGESSRAKKGYTIPAMAGDLEMLVRTLNVPHVALVGWSMGGMIAQELARRLGDRVSALVLVGTTPGGLADPKAPDFDQARLDGMRAAVRTDLKTSLRGLATQFFNAGTEAPLHSWAFHEIQKTPAAVVETCFESILAADLRPHLKDIKVPTLVLHGRHDALIPLAHGEQLKKGIPGAALTVFEHSAHAPFLEEPDAFNTTLTNFLLYKKAEPAVESATPQPKASPAAKAPPAPKSAPAPKSPTPSKPAPASKSAAPRSGGPAKAGRGAKPAAGKGTRKK